MEQLMRKIDPKITPLEPAAYLKKVLIVAKYFRIFPAHIKSGQKRPRIKKWYQQATQDVKQIGKWWKKWPDALVGLPTGSANDLMAVDVDVKGDESGFEALKQLEELPATLCQNTPRGGKHFILRIPEDTHIPNGTDVLGRCIDIRGETGFIVFYPSPGYERKGNFIDIADAPDWLIEAVQKNKRDPIEQLNEGRQLSEFEIHKYLRDLNITEYRDRSGWLKIVIAVKAASRGEDYGFEAVLRWSTDDSEFFGKDIEPDLRQIWETVDADRAGGISAGTLVHESRKAIAEKGEEFASIEATSSELCLTFAGKKKDALAKEDGNIIRLLTVPRLLLPGHSDVEDNPFFGHIVFNELKQTEVFIRRPCWISPETTVDFKDKKIEDADIIELMCRLQDPPFNQNFGKIRTWDAVSTAARRNRCNPVTGYLDGLKWDKIERLGDFLIDYAGAERTEYTRVVSKKTLISAVARAYKPGCKADHVLILEGDQGCRKSTLVDILGGEWYSAPHSPVGNTDAEENLQGVWIAEFAEMWNITAKKEVGMVKEFITNRCPRFRRKFGRGAADYPRRCIFIGTLNPDHDGRYLSDPTGGRRFWPVGLNKTIFDPIETEKVAEIRDQLWAEAVVLYKGGEQWHLTRHEGELASSEQRARQMKHAWEDDISRWLTMGDGKDKAYVQCNTIAHDLFGVRSTELNRSRRDIGRILRNLGWRHGTIVEGHGHKRIRFDAYRRPEIEIDIE